MDIRILASGSSGNAYRISDGHTSLLLDAGIPIKAIQVGCSFKTSQLAGCFVTHSHLDHSKAAKDLIKLGVDIYTSQGTIDACGLTGHRVKRVESLKEIRVGTFKVLPFDVEHDAPEPLGFLFESTETGDKLLYFTDTYFLRYKFQGLTHIMGECNYSQEALQKSIDQGYTAIERAPRIVKSHMSLETFLEFLEANDLSQVKQIYLLHLSDNNSDEEAFKKAVQEATGAEVYVC